MFVTRDLKINVKLPHTEQKKKFTASTSMFGFILSFDRFDL